MAAAQGGDRDAMDALLRRHQDRMWAICRRLAGNDADAADALQEAMVLVVRRLDSFDGRARFTTWAHRVTTNACLDELRRRNRRPVDGLPDDEDDESDRPRRTLADDARPVDATVAEQLTVDAALAELPEDFRVPVILRDLGGHDYAEIAEILDIPPGTVRSRIARARRRLGELLGEPGSTGEVASTDEARPASDRRVGGNQPSTTERPSEQP
ncbi:MAG: sigma-70 family RNA polymerase sigma factor [Acidimicrobiales bacterium]|nr:sigma-70 family RNA polymerase sigma factor [Acidimicrobiales bacterium]